jgi:hypothetical protein
MYELFIFHTLVGREAPDVEQEPVTMIQHMGLDNENTD